MRRGRLAVAALALAVASAAVAWVGRGVIDRLRHPARYATSGDGRISATAYVAAARRAMAPGDHIARLTLPIGDGPVVVDSGSTTIFLDPPTARVLDVAPSTGNAATIDAAQSIDSVIVRARPYGGGGSLRGVEWPTARNPDWTVRFGRAGEAVKVADDSGTARAAPARRTGVAAGLVGQIPIHVAPTFGARLTIFLAGMVVAAAALVGIGKEVRRRSSPSRVRPSIRGQAAERS